MGLVSNFSEAMRTVFKWYVKAQVTTPSLRPLPQHTLSCIHNDTYDLPVEVGSSAELPQHLQLASQAPGFFAGLRHLVKVQAFTDRGSFVPLEGELRISLSANIVSGLVFAGVLTTQTNDADIVCVALNPSHIDWRNCIAMWNPKPLGHYDVLCYCENTTKVQCLLLLHGGGWQPGSSTLSGSHVHGEARQYRSGIKQPLSYFEALCKCNAIAAKGVNRIRHGCTDNYYKCLLHMNSDALQLFLEQWLLGQTDAWCKQQLLDKVEATPPDGDDDELMIGNGEGIDEAGNIVGDDIGPLAIPDVVVTSLWSRCIAHTGGTSRHVRVYFDSASHSSGIQRGWVECPAHNCRRYRDVNRTKAEFVSDMYQWMIDSTQPHIGSKADHLSHMPDDPTVAALAPNIIMEPF